MVATVTLSCVSLTSSLQNPASLAVSNSTPAELAGHIRATKAHGRYTEDSAAERDTTAAGARRPGRPGQPAACPGQQESPRNPAMKHKQPLRTILLAARSAKQGMGGERGLGVRGVQEVSRLLPLQRQDRARLVHLWKTFFSNFWMRFCSKETFYLYPNWESIM